MIQKKVSGIKSIKTKLIIIFLLIGLSCIFSVASFSFFNARSIIISLASNQLSSIKELKKRIIMDFFLDKKKQIDLFSGNQLILNSIKEYGTVFKFGFNSVEYKQVEANRNSFLKRYAEIFEFQDLMLISPDGTVILIWDRKQKKE